MYRIAIRYMGRDKDDTVTGSINEDAVVKFRGELADLKSASPFITVEATDKTIILRRDNVISVTLARDDRERCASDPDAQRTLMPGPALTASLLRSVGFAMTSRGVCRAFGVLRDLWVGLNITLRLALRTCCFLCGLRHS